MLEPENQNDDPWKEWEDNNAQDWADDNLTDLDGFEHVYDVPSEGNFNE